MGACIFTKVQDYPQTEALEHPLGPEERSPDMYVCMYICMYE